MHTTTAPAGLLEKFPHPNGPSKVFAVQELYK
jgi:hypothetical protein